jgi:hypothetical protein
MGKNLEITVNKEHKTIQVNNGIPFRIAEYIQDANNNWAKFNWDTGEYELIAEDNISSINPDTDR